MRTELKEEWFVVSEIVLRVLYATYDELTGEMQLFRQSDGAVILSTKNAEAFYSGASLLGENSIIDWPSDFCLFIAPPIFPTTIDQVC